MRERVLLLLILALTSASAQLSRITEVYVKSEVPGSMFYTWKAAPQAEAVEGYEVAVFDTIKRFPSNTTEVVISCSVPCSEYLIKVRSYKDHLIGEYSPVLKAMTLPDAPNPVTAVAPSLGDDGTYIDVSIIDTSAKPTCTPWEYDVNIYQGGTLIRSMKAHTQDFTISGLTVSTSYTIGVAVSYPKVNLKSEEVVSNSITTSSIAAVFSGVPTNLSLTEQSGIYTLQWNSLAGAVTYNVKLNGVDYRTGLTTTSTTLQNIEDCKEYYFTVVGVDANSMKSADSEPLDGNRVYDYPESVGSKVDVLDANTAIVRVVDGVKRPQCGKYLYRVTNGQNTVDSYSKNFYLNGLTAGTEYTITVKVIEENSSLESDASTAVSFTTSTVALPTPSTPTIDDTEFNDYDQLIITWSDGAAVSGVVIKEYYVEISDDDGLIEVVKTSAKTLYYQIERCKTYYAKIAALSEDNKLSPFTATRNCGMKRPIPGPVKSVSLTQNNASLVVTVVLSDSVTCSPTSLKIDLYVQRKKLVSVETNFGQGLTHTFTNNLMTGLTYVAYVRQIDDDTSLKGPEVISEEVEFNNGPALDAPTNLTITSKSETSLGVSWTAVTGATGYDVTYFAGDLNPIILSTNTPTITLSNLVACSYYQIYVQAKTSTSISPYSDVLKDGTNSETSLRPVTSVFIYNTGVKKIDWHIIDAPRTCTQVTYQGQFVDGNTLPEGNPVTSQSGSWPATYGGSGYFLKAKVVDITNPNNVSAGVLSNYVVSLIGGSVTPPSTNTVYLEVNVNDIKGNPVMFNSDFYIQTSSAYQKLVKDTCNGLTLISNLGGSFVWSCKVTSFEQGPLKVYVTLKIESQTATSSDYVEKLMTGMKKLSPGAIIDLNFVLSSNDVIVDSFI